MHDPMLYMFTSLPILTHAHPHTCTSSRLYTPCAHPHTYTCTCTCTFSYSPYKCTITLSCLHTCTLSRANSHMTPSHMHTLSHTHTHTPSHTSTRPHTYIPSCTRIITHAHLTHTHPHTYTPSPYPHTCTPSQTPRVLYAIVLFDPLAADFNIDGVWLVMYNGQQRPLSGQRALQAVGTQINQRIVPPDRIHIKVYTCISRLFFLPPFPPFLLYLFLPFSISSSLPPYLSLNCLLFLLSFIFFFCWTYTLFKPLLSPPSLPPPSPPTRQVSVTPRSGTLGQLVLFDFGSFHLVQALMVHVLSEQETKLLQSSQSKKGKEPQKP